MKCSFPNFEPVCCSMSGSNCCFLICIQASEDILYLMLNPNSYNTDRPFSTYRQVVVCIYVAHVFCVQAGLKDILGLAPDHLNNVNIKIKQVIWNFLFVQIKVMFILYCSPMMYNSIIYKKGVYIYICVCVCVYIHLDCQHFIAKRMLTIWAFIG